MTTRNANRFGWFGLLSGLLFSALISVTPAQAGDDEKSASGKLEGTWFTQVSIRDCQTGAVLRTFSALNSFNAETTMIDTTTGASPSQRSPGQGKWERTGPQTYSATSLAFLFTPAGVWTGTQKLTHVIRVNGDENTFTRTSGIFDTAGNLLTSGCATAVGHRL